MSFTNMPISLVIDSSQKNRSFALTIQQASTGYYYNPLKNIFDPTYQNAGGVNFALHVAAISMPFGDPASEWENCISCNLSLDPAVFTDGSYSLFYLDVTVIPGKIINLDYFDIFKGDYRVSNPTDNAIRLLDARVGNSTVRNTLLMIQEWIAKQK